MRQELPAPARIDPDVIVWISPEVRLPQSTMRMLLESVQNALGIYPTHLEAMGTLRALVSTQRATLQVSDVFLAAHEAAVLAAEQGQAEQADAITAVTAEVSEVLESGSLESLERAVTDLAKRLERDAGKRDRDVLNVYLWYLAIILAFFMYLNPR